MGGRGTTCTPSRSSPYYVETGAKAWHFQGVHHGIWDYDFPAAPILVDITVDGRPVKALAQVSKQAFVYVLDRETGEPVWPIEERPVPQEPNVPGEQLSRTQPFPTKPAAFDRQGVLPDELIDFTPALRAEAEEILKQWDHGPLFTPLTERGTLTTPGFIGVRAGRVPPSIRSRAFCTCRR